MKILLINSLQFDCDEITDIHIRNKSLYINPPLGLMYIASSIKQASKDAQIVFYDYNMEWIKQASLKGVEYTLKNDPLELILKENHFDIIGIACMFFLFKDHVQHLLKRVVSCQKNAILVLGGGYPTYEPQDSLKAIEEGIAVIGEGENSVKYIIKTYIRCGGNFEEMVGYLKKCDGITIKHNNEIIINEKKEFIQNIDEICFPAHEDINYSDYIEYGRFNARPTYLNYLTAVMTTSRGCPCKCIFCGVPSFWGENIRYRSPKNVLSEIKLLYEKYNIRHFVFNDSNLTFNRERAKEICRHIIDSEMDIKWCAPDGMAIWTFDEELIKLMIDSGCYAFSIGIESGNDYILTKIVRKPLNIKKLKENMKLLMKYRDSIYVSGLLMLGIPYETKAQMQDTISLACDLQLDWYEFAVTLPYPNTPLWDICLKEGYIKPAQDMSDVRYLHSYINTPEFTAEEVRDIAYDANICVNFLNNINYKKYDIGRAIEDFQRINSRYPGHLFAKYMLYKAYTKKREFQQAEELKREVEYMVAANDKYRTDWSRYALSF